MAKIISITNQKGGVGKTTTAINLSTQISNYCKSVLIVDIDPQANSTSGFGFDKNKITKSIYNVLIDEYSVKQVIQKTIVEWLDLIPSNLDLIGAEVELVNVLSRESKLKNALCEITNIYDYIFIDCPPSLGLLTVNALNASDSVLIPVQCEYLALEGLAQLLKTINLVRKQLNPKLELEGVLLTMYDSRTNLSEQVKQEIIKFFQEKVYKTIIPRNIRLAEAPSFGKPVAFYDKYSKGTKSYEDLAKEFITQNF